MGKRGRKTLVRVPLTVTSQEQNTIETTEVKPDKETSIQNIVDSPWETLNLDLLTTSELQKRMAIETMPSRIAVLSVKIQASLPLDAKAIVQAYSLSDKEKAILEKNKLTSELADSLSSYLTTRIDRVFGVRKHFIVTSEGKAKESFSFTSNRTHKVGGVPYILSLSLTVKEDSNAPLTEREKWIMAYEADCQAYEAEIEKMIALSKGHDYKAMQSEKAFPQGISSNTSYVVNK